MSLRNRLTSPNKKRRAQARAKARAGLEVDGKLRKTLTSRDKKVRRHARKKALKRLARRRSFKASQMGGSGEAGTQSPGINPGTKSSTY